MTEHHTDGWLILRIRGGDVDALGELYERYKTQVYRTAVAITRDERAAEDILQEAFIRVYTYAGTIDENLTLGPWLYRVTVNLAYSWTTRVKRWLSFIQDIFDHWISPAQRHPEMVAEEQEWKHNLWQALDVLPPAHRVVTILHYLEGLSLREIAYVMDIPEGTVKSRLHYARETLKKAIQERGRRLVPEVAYDFT